jgi:hypothetical protein
MSLKKPDEKLMPGSDCPRLVAANSMYLAVSAAILSARSFNGSPAKLPEDDDRRLSLCCSQCRRRTTPPSVRFLGRRVYLAAVVVLVQRDAAPAVVASRSCGALIGVSRRSKR